MSQDQTQDVAEILKTAFSTHTNPTAKYRRHPKVSDPETGKPISPRKLRQKQVAVAVMEPGATYTSVGEKLYPDAKYPRQTVYNTVHLPSVQAILKGEDAAIDQKKHEIIEKVQRVSGKAEKKGQYNAAITGIALEAKIEGLLIDQVVQTNKPLSAKDLREVPESELLEAIFSRIDTQQSATPDHAIGVSRAISRAISDEVGKDTPGSGSSGT